MDWTNILNGVYILIYIWALWRVISGYAHYKYSFGWILLAVVIPYTAFITYEFYRRRAYRQAGATPKQLQVATFRYRVSICFLIAAFAVVFIPGVAYYYQLMGGVQPEAVFNLARVTTIGLISVSALYGVFLLATKEGKQ